MELNEIPEDVVGGADKTGAGKIGTIAASGAADGAAGAGTSGAGEASPTTAAVVQSADKQNGSPTDPASLPAAMSTSAEEDLSHMCGVGRWRPQALQRCANMRAFTVILSCVTVFGSMNFSYYTSVITQIEKRFGLSSSTTGFIKNIDNIGYMSTVLFFAHFCRYSNKPRLFALATVGVSFSIFLFAVPHFLYGGPDSGFSDALLLLNSSSANVSGASTFEFCRADRGAPGDNGCGSGSYLATLNVGALAIFVVSELLQGISQSPKFTLSLTYMDDNAKKNSPKYFGFLFGTRALAPVFGFMLGAWATSIYVDLSDPGLSRKDPRWIGAWWIGFVICAACSLVWAAPMVLFPSRTDDDGRSRSADPEQSEPTAKRLQASSAASLPVDGSKAKRVDELKDLPRAVWRLITNPVFVLVNIGACFNAYMIGFSAFLPKYIEMHFGFTASKASVLTGGVSAFGWALGPIVAGRLMSSIRITPPNSLRIVIVLHLVAAVGYSVVMLFACPDAKWAGTLSLDRPQVDFECNRNCTCDVTVFTPVCGDDGLNYFSPCFAGCTGEVITDGTEKVFDGCACVPGGRAVEGECARECSTLVPYLITICVSLFVSSMTTIPMMMTLMRCVDYKDKALSLALFTFIIQIVSFPSAAMFGSVIDTTCLVQQTLCGRKGACLYYDNASFHLLLHGMSVVLKAAATVAYGVAFFVSRRRTFEQDDHDDIVEVKAEDDDDGDGRASPLPTTTTTTPPKRGDPQEDRAMLTSVET